MPAYDVLWYTCRAPISCEPGSLRGLAAAVGVPLMYVHRPVVCGFGRSALPQALVPGTVVLGAVVWQNGGSDLADPGGPCVERRFGRSVPIERALVGLEAAQCRFAAPSAASFPSRSSVEISVPMSAALVVAFTFRRHSAPSPLVRWCFHHSSHRSA